MTRTVRAALADGTARLSTAGVQDAARDARRLMAAALAVPADRLTLLAADPLPAPAAAVFERMLDERSRFRPVAQITGRRSFWGRDFAVTAAVLDPRPETETLVALALAGTAAASVLDLGTGSGALLVTLLAEWPAARGTGVDIDPAALAVAAANAAALGVAARARFKQGDWTEGLAGRYELIVANPPYVPEAEVAALAADVRDWEPRHALTAGPSGLEAYQALAPALPKLLAPKGRALLEIGAGQGPAVAAIFRAAGFAQVALHPDLDGRTRVVEAAGSG